MSDQYTIGLDYGTNSVRALIVNGATSVKITLQQVLAAAKKRRLNISRS